MPTLQADIAERIFAKTRMPSPITVRLSDFILEQMECILQAWEDFARTIEPPALTMDAKALRNHASHMLRTIALDLGTAQSPLEQSEKSKGRASRQDDDTAAETHAATRLLAGFTVEQLVSEYRALRASVLKLWAENAKSGLDTDPDDIMRFNEAIDQALAESVARYAQMVKQSQNLFLAILGHDLRNPLGTAMTSASFIMRAADIDHKYIVAATRILHSAQRMGKLVDDLIDFTRTHLGSGLPIQPKQSNIANICLAVVEELRTFHPDHAIEFDADGKLEGLWDEGRIAQVFSNLIGNAVQHGVKTEPIKICLHSETDDIVATVNNRGMPIDPRNLQTIFEPLVRFADIDVQEYSRETSLGIGLFIARVIVQAHSGNITVTSSMQHGTTFTVRLPRIPTFDVTAAQQTETRTPVTAL